MWPTRHTRSYTEHNVLVVMVVNGHVLVMVVVMVVSVVVAMIVNEH